MPAYLGLIVASEAAQSISSGPISGDARRIVVVKTDPGYDPNAGHAGTGTVTATAC